MIVNPTEHVHAVQFYTEDHFLLSGLCDFVRSALTQGESVVLVMTKTHHNGLNECLQSAGVDVSDARKDGRYVVLDAADTLSKFMAGEMPDPRKFSSVVGALIGRAQSVALDKNKRVAVFGEMVAVLWAERRFDAAIRLEKLWNELARNHHFHLRCAYPLSGFDGDLKGEPYSMICAEHSSVMLPDAHA
jgi:hypothetical protein